MKLSPIYLVTKAVLKYCPPLRTVEKREEVVKEVWGFLPHASFESITRCCRQIQNTEGLYNNIIDNRIELEVEYRDYFKK